MKFGRLSLDEAEGAILAHAVDAGEAGLLKKGQLLTSAMISALEKAGVANVLAAKLEDGDVNENQAAFEIASNLCGINCVVAEPFTGRSNLIADVAGVLQLDRELLQKTNTIDPSITIATLKHLDAVEKGQMVATVKIIPFSTKADYVKSVIGYAELSSNKLLKIAPYKKKKIGVISTTLPSTPSKIIAKSERIMTDRLARCANQIDYRVTTEHHENNLSQEIASMKADGCNLILIFGASAITDTKDVIPAAIEKIGGQVTHFGMPVDPGNLLLLGSLGTSTIVGLPGCTRSPKLNGFDWVLQRLIADIPVSPTDIMGMGEGGLLKEISSRPQPRTKEIAIKSQKPQIAALLLAAGQSRRMGPQNKLLALIDGKPMVRHVAETLQKVELDEILMVTGHQADDVLKSMWDLNLPSVQNPNYKEGLSASLKVGFEILKDRVDGILVCLGDMPYLSAQSIEKLIKGFNPENGKSIVIPTSDGKRGNPVLLSTQYWPDIKTLSGDLGARAIIVANDHAVEAVEIDSTEIFMDIDTPEILAAVTNAQDRNR